MYKKTKRVLFLLFIVTSLNIVISSLNQSVTQISATTHESNEKNASYPRLFVTKYANKQEVAIGDSIVVTVTIKNFGNKTAHNVTFIDKLNQPWIFNISGLTQLSYGQIGINESRQFSYLVTTKSIGIYRLYAAQIEYYDSELNPSKFITISNELVITVIEPPEDFSLANFNTVITLFIALIMLDIFLVIRLFAPRFNRRPKDNYE
ncbi:MAG: hypothetical protein ACFFB2_05345 [Promethearchaeota archaeon]